MTLAGEQRYDLAVLDVTMPGMSGFELCRRLRDQVHGIGIILLTARDAVDDRVQRPGCRRRRLSDETLRLRRTRGAASGAAPPRGRTPPARSQIGGLAIDLACQRISVGDREARLSRTEFDLLRLLAARPDEVLPRAGDPRDDLGFRQLHRPQHRRPVRELSAQEARLHRAAGQDRHGARASGFRLSADPA